MSVLIVVCRYLIGPVDRIHAEADCRGYAAPAAECAGSAEDGEDVCGGWIE